MEMNIKTITSRLSNEGVSINPNEVRVLVTLAPLAGADYDEKTDWTTKRYHKEPLTLPFSLCMRKRSANHYLNINERINMVMGRIDKEKPTVCFNEGWVGVLANVKGKDPKGYNVKVECDQY